MSTRTPIKYNKYLEVILTACVDKNLSLGYKGKPPFKINDPIDRFRELPLGTTIVMGRKTWEQLPAQYRPLPFRTCMVISRNPNYKARGAQVFTELKHALFACRSDKVYVVGGVEILEAALPYVTRIELLMVDAVAEKSDVALPFFDKTKFTVSNGPFLKKPKSPLRYHPVEYKLKYAYNRIVLPDMHDVLESTNY